MTRQPNWALFCRERNSSWWFLNAFLVFSNKSQWHQKNFLHRSIYPPMFLLARVVEMRLIKQEWRTMRPAKQLLTVLKAAGPCWRRACSSDCLPLVQYGGSLQQLCRYSSEPAPSYVETVSAGFDSLVDGMDEPSNHPAERDRQHEVTTPSGRTVADFEALIDRAARTTRCSRACL
jgi:hypothetical protein